MSSVTYLELWKEKKSYLRVQHYVFDQISVLRKSQAEGFILTNGSKGKYNLNCRLVKQKPQKPDALACYKHLHLSVHSSNRMTSSILRTLRCGDYGLRTTGGSHFQDWDETRVFPHPTVASSRRCVVEGFYVVWKGGLRIHHKGMKKQFNARKLRNSCCLILELQTNARLEQLQELMNSVQRKMHR